MGDSLENTETAADAPNVTIVDYGAFTNYLRKAATILLPEEDAVPPALNVALEDPTNQDCIKKFLSDPQIQSLYIQRSCSKGKKSSWKNFLGMATKMAASAVNRLVKSNKEVVVLNSNSTWKLGVKGNSYEGSRNSQRKSPIGWPLHSN